jgi:hypothetical protein
MQTVVTPMHRKLSPLQMLGIILIANTAVRAIANVAPSPHVVQNVVETVAETIPQQ